MGDYGAAVSQKGYDVKTCDDRFLVWSSAFQNFKIYNRYSVSTTIPASGSNVITITHNLGYYAPFIVIYNGASNDSGYFMYVPNATPFWGRFDGRYVQSFQNTLDIIVYSSFGNLATGTTVYFTVYLLLNDFTTITEQNINTGLTSGASNTDYGIICSKDGYDVKTATQDQLSFSSSYPGYIIDKIEKVTISSNNTNYYVTHSLGYVPNVLVYDIRSGDSYMGMAFFGRGLEVVITDQKVRLRDSSLASSWLGEYWVVIFKDKLN